MSKLHIKRGVYGLADTLEGVDDVRIMSEPWEVDGVDLIAITVDYTDGSSEQLTAIQKDYWREE